MEPGPTASDRDARLLGLALLHGYVEADQLQRAAEVNSSPSRILAELRRSGTIDDPCLEGLEQALKEFPSPNTPGNGTGPTHLEPPRHLSATADGGRPAAASQDDDSGRWDSGARLLRQFTVAQWKQYRNLRFIGEGGMGRIYKAQDPDLKRTVALKFLRGQDPGQLKRFLFEAQAQALMEHPNICRVYEISEWQGQHYIAMQYVNGPTLLRAAPVLDFDEKLRIAEVVAGAVHAAHRRGLIHRDLKPANVMLEKGEDGRHKPYVLDFGLARELDAPGMTSTGLVLGTTAYLSPEQARGEAHHVDRRTDIYGLGATLYELFSGRPPFGEAIGMACIQKVLDEEPPPLRALAPHLPKDLETVVMKCLEKDPSRRYDDAHSLAEDLRRVREGEPILARPVTLGYRLRRYARRNRTLVATAAVAVAAVLVATGFAAYTRFTASARARWAQHFGQEAERIEALVRYYRLMPSHDIRPDLERVRSRMAELEARGRQLGTLAKGPMEYALGRAHLAIGEEDQAKRLLETAWREGFRTGEVSHAYSRVLESEYWTAVDRIRRTPDTDQRKALQTRLEHDLLGPLLWHMRAGQGATMEPALFQEARLAFYESRLEEAVVKTSRLLEQDSWVFEAQKLQAEALQSMARDKGAGPARLALLDRARAALKQAQKIARSDATLLLEESRVLRTRMEEGDETDRDVARSVRECLEILDSARRIGSHAPDCDAMEAWAWAFMGRSLSVTGSNPVPAYQRAIDSARRCLDMTPENLEALNALTFAHGYLGVHLWGRGADPRGNFSEAMRSGEMALRKNPYIPFTLQPVFKVVVWKMGYETSLGLSPEATYREGLTLADRISARMSNNPFFHLQVGHLHNEWAEYERIAGHPPDAFVEEALRCFQKVLDGYPANEEALRGKGMANLILGEYLLGSGQDPIKTLDMAQAAFETTLRDHPNSARSCSDAGTSRLFQAIFLLQRGRNPMDAIGQARAYFDRSLKINPGYAWCQFKLARLEETEGRWRARQSVSPVPSFKRGIEAAGKALALSKDPEFFAIYVSLCSGLASSDAVPEAWIQKGSDALARGRELHPRNGELMLAGAELWMVKSIRARSPEDRDSCKAKAKELLRVASALQGSSGTTAGERLRAMESGG